MKFNVTEIEFDFDDGDFDDPITFEEQVQITHDNLGVSGKQTMKMTWLKKSLPQVGGALKKLIMRFN